MQRCFRDLIKLFPAWPLIQISLFSQCGWCQRQFFEWVQNKSEYYWAAETVYQKLNETMPCEFDNVYQLMEKHKTDMRTAAYIHALHRYA
ncbi:MAG: hypothetical protein P4M14_06180 [Gammaproteobacteria bacterium]|nr:hypothetical protein [Gammaproteobacteria bacterium]